LLILSSTAEANNFEEINELILNHLDLNISDVSKLPEVKYLSSDSIEHLISKKEMNNNSSFFARFETLTNWIKNNEVNDELKSKLLSWFDLKKFTSHQLTSVRRTKLFSEASILDVLEDKVEKLESKVLKLTEDKKKAILSLQRPLGAKLKYDLLTKSQSGITYPQHHFGAFEADTSSWLDDQHQVFTLDAVTQDDNGVITIKAVEYVSGRITSGRLNSYKIWSTSQSPDIKMRGYVEVHATLPAKINGTEFKGSWPAIYLLDCYFSDIEIDIVEMINGEPRIHMTTHSPSHNRYVSGGLQPSPPYVANADFTEDPLIAGFEWNIQKEKSKIDLTWWMSWYDISLHKWVSHHTTKSLSRYKDKDYNAFYESFTGRGFSLVINLAEGGNWPGHETFVNPEPHYMTVLSAKVYGFD